MTCLGTMWNSHIPNTGTVIQEIITRSKNHHGTEVLISFNKWDIFGNLLRQTSTKTMTYCPLYFTELQKYVLGQYTLCLSKIMINACWRTKSNVRTLYIYKNCNWGNVCINTIQRRLHVFESKLIKVLRNIPDTLYKTWITILIILLFIIKFIKYCVGI